MQRFGFDERPIEIEYHRANHGRDSLHAPPSFGSVLPLNLLTGTKSRIFSFRWVQGSPLPKEACNPRRVSHSIKWPHQDRDDLALAGFAADQRASRFDCHVEFAAHPEFSGQINSWLDRKARVVDERAIVQRFERVQIGAGAMHFAADRMPGAMDERVTEADSLDYRARGAIGFAAADGVTSCDPTLHQIDGGVARIGDNLENARVLVGNFVARERDPGEVGVDTVGR